MFLSPNIGQDGSRWLQVGSKLAHVGPSWGDFGPMLANLRVQNHCKKQYKINIFQNYALICSRCLKIGQHTATYANVEPKMLPKCSQVAPKMPQDAPTRSHLEPSWPMLGLKNTVKNNTKSIFFKTVFKHVQDVLR